MYDENGSETAHGNNDKSRLRLVDPPIKQKKASGLPEPAANELRELIEDVRRNTPRKKQAVNDDSLPPAA